MKNTTILFTLIIFSTSFFSACKKDTIYPESAYPLYMSFPDSSQQHPKNDVYQNIIDDAVNQGLLGVSVMINDADGTWLGAGGYADIASSVRLQPGHQFMIGSITKTITATAIFMLVDEGILSIEDPISDWVDADVMEQIANAKEAKIKHLLNHRSGLPDWYTIRLEMERYNEVYNDFTQEDLLEFTYGKPATNGVDEAYNYSNTNYVLLGIILENATGKTLREVYHEKIFTPLGLQSAYFDIQEKALPESVVRGYMNLYGNGYVESEVLYGDEMSTADGGIAINAQDLGVFMQALTGGKLVSEASFNQMKDWFDVPFKTRPKNGYGLEYFSFDTGVAYGHTGGVDGFSTSLYYFFEKDVTIVRLHNHTGDTDEVNDVKKAFDQILERAVLNP